MVSLIFAIAIFLASSECFSLGIGVSTVKQFVCFDDVGKYTVSNHENHQIAVEVCVEKSTFSPDGEEYCEFSDELSVYPKQFVLNPNSQRIVKVRYKSNGQQLSEEKIFRVIIKELPIAFEQCKNNNVRIVASYRTLYYVLPKNPKSSININSISIIDGKLVMEIKNEGNCHTHLNNSDISIMSKEKNNYDSLSKNFSANLDRLFVPANSTRIFTADANQLSIDDKAILLMRFDDDYENSFKIEKSVQLANIG